MKKLESLFNEPCELVRRIYGCVMVALHDCCVACLPFKFFKFAEIGIRVYEKETSNRMLQQSVLNLKPQSFVSAALVPELLILGRSCSIE